VNSSGFRAASARRGPNMHDLSFGSTDILLQVIKIIPYNVKTSLTAAGLYSC
jgi:hypothetical protein